MSVVPHTLWGAVRGVPPNGAQPLRAGFPSWAPRLSPTAAAPSSRCIVAGGFRRGWVQASMTVNPRTHGGSSSRSPGTGRGRGQAEVQQASAVPRHPAVNIVGAQSFGGGVGVCRFQARRCVPSQALGRLWAMCGMLCSAGEGLWPLARFCFWRPASCRYVFWRDFGLRLTGSRFPGVAARHADGDRVSRREWRHLARSVLCGRVFEAR